MTPPAGYDLHTHSSCSDGTLPPAAVVERAAAAGLRGLALTDHDTTAGWPEAGAACAARGLAFVPGIELSAASGGAGVHLLGYWVDGDDPDLAAECARLRGERERRARRMVERLQDLGVPVTVERVRAAAGDAPIGRPHVAAALVELGAVGDPDEAFDRYLAEGRPAHEPKRALDAVDAVGLLRSAGGVAVLAHPGCSGATPSLLDRLTAAGLAGLECDHPGHEPAEADRWRAEAGRRDLVPTGSSDFHGDRKDAMIGERTTSEVTLGALRSRRAPARRKRAPGVRADAAGAPATAPRVEGTAVREDSTW